MNKPVEFSQFLQLVDSFLVHLQSIRRYSPHTVAAYRRDLAQFSAYSRKTTEQSGTDNVCFDESLVRGYIHHLRLQQASAGTLHRKLSSLRSFFNYLLEAPPKDSPIKTNPVAGIKLPKNARKLPKVLDIDQTMQLLDSSGEPDSFMQARDSAILEVFYSCGLRLSELVALDLTDLDLASGELRVTGKGSKQRIVPIGQQAIQALNRWLDCRKSLPSLVDSKEQAVFVSQRGKRLGNRSVQLRIKAAGGQMAFNHNLHPHLLRHSFASHMLESSGDLRAVQEMLGHANLSTTQVYTHLNYQQLAEVYDKAHPKAKKRKSTTKT